MTSNSVNSSAAALPAIQDLPDQLVDEAGNPNFGIFRGIPELVDLSELSDPYARNRMGQFLRHKRWIYIFAATDEVIIAGAVVDAGPSGTGFLMVTDRATGEVIADVSRPGGTRPLVRVGNKPLAGHESQYLFAGTNITARGDDSELSFRAKFQKLPYVPLVSGPWIDLDLQLAHVTHHGITAISKVDHDPPMVTTTAKNAALPTSGRLTINEDGRKIDFDLTGGLGGFDFTSGYLPRETSWRWAFTTGTTTAGQVVGLNLVSDFSGIGDQSVENVIWVDGTPHRLDSAARIECDRDDLMKPWPIYTNDGAVDLLFHPLTVHRESLNLGIVRSRFIQPSGHYTGSIRVGDSNLELDALPGVIEDQDVLW
jgi:hypothetical protein